MYHPYLSFDTISYGGAHLPCCTRSRWQVTSVQGQEMRKSERASTRGYGRDEKGSKEWGEDKYRLLIEPHFIPKGDSGYRGLSQKSLPITISQKSNTYLKLFNDHVPVRIVAAFGRSLDSFSCLAHCINMLAMLSVLLSFLHLHNVIPYWYLHK